MPAGFAAIHAVFNFTLWVREGQHDKPAIFAALEAEAREGSGESVGYRHEYNLLSYRRFTTDIFNDPLYDLATRNDTVTQEDFHVTNCLTSIVTK
jgi:hypothetical protein